MKVVTIATDLANPFLVQLLNPSCQAVGLDLVVLHPARSTFTFADKRRVLTEHLSRVADRDELVAFTDAYDALFIRGPEYIESRYERVGVPVLFSGELNSWPLGVVGIALHPGPPVGRYPYLNSGGFIGPAGDILDLCAKYPQPPIDQFPLLRHLRSHGYHLDERYSWSDQYHWTLVHLIESEMTGVDHDGVIFEYFGPQIPDVVYSEVMRDVHEFAERGVEAPCYQRERDRLAARLDTPSDAAQVHFASSMTKAALLELLEEDRVPQWLRIAHELGPMAIHPRQVVYV